MRCVVLPTTTTTTTSSPGRATTTTKWQQNNCKFSCDCCHIALLPCLVCCHHHNWRQYYFVILRNLKNVINDLFSFHFKLCQLTQHQSQHRRDSVFNTNWSRYVVTPPHLTAHLNISYSTLFGQNGNMIICNKLKSSIKIFCQTFY